MSIGHWSWEVLSLVSSDPRKAFPPFNRRVWGLVEDHQVARAPFVLQVEFTMTEPGKIRIIVHPHGPMVNEPEPPYELPEGWHIAAWRDLDSTGA